MTPRCLILGHSELQHGEGRERHLMQLWFASSGAWIAIPRVVSYILSSLTLEMNVRELPGPRLTLETSNCTRTNFFHYYMVCILPRHEQDSDSAPYSWHPLTQTNWYPDGPPEESSVPCGQSLLLASRAGTLRTTDLMQLSAVCGPCPRELLHSAASWWAPGRWQLDGQLCSLPGLATV